MPITLVAMGGGSGRAFLLRAFAALPPRVRRALVRAGTTRFTVGCVVVVVRDTAVLLLDQPHHKRLGLPGGLLERYETPAACIAREVREELGVELDVGREPNAVLVDGRARRVDLVFLVRDLEASFSPTSPEVRALHWLPQSSLPRGTAVERAVRAVLDGEGRLE